MTALVSRRAPTDAERSQTPELSLGRAFWLLAGLRLTRWRRRGLGFWRAPAGSAARPRSGTTRATGSVGLLAWLGLMLGTYCLQSFQSLADLVREHGRESLPRHAALLSSLQVACLVALALPGSRAFAREEGDDQEWLSTLPAPAWILHSAKLAEAALLNPLGWLLLFPFFTGLGIHNGLGPVAMLVALGFTLPLLLCTSLLGSVIDSAPLTLSRSRLFRIFRFVGPLLGSVVVLFWLGAPSLRMLKLDTWQWLEGVPDFAWLPFSEPARVLSSWRSSPREALAWLALFGAEMVALLGLGAFALRTFYRAELLLGRDARRGVRGTVPVTGTPRRRSFGGAFETVAKEELLWLWRNPSQGGRLVLGIVVLNGLALRLASLAPGLAPTVIPGLTLFGIGVLLLVAQAPLLERERPALWQWAALPRPMSRVFAGKTLFMAALATLGAVPAVVYGGWSLPHRVDAIPALLYGLVGLVSTAFLQTALWFSKVSTVNPTTQSQQVSRTLQLGTFAAWLGALGLASPSAFASLPSLAYGVALAWLFWTSSFRRAPFVLDSSAPEPRVLTATYALVTILLMRGQLDAATAEGLRRGLSPSHVAALSYFFAVVLVLPGSLLWLQFGRRVTGVREQLGLSKGRGLGVILRESLFWSVLAIACHMGYAFLEALFLQKAAQPPQPVSVLAASPMTLVVITCMAAPLVEELLYRGMLYRSLRASHGMLIGLLISASLFALAHPFASLVPVFVAGVCMTLALERSRSFYAAVLVHVLYNSVPAWIALHLRGG